MKKILLLLLISATSHASYIYKSGGGTSIGGSIVGGLDNSILFVDPAGTLAQDNANFSYNSSTKEISLGGYSLIPLSVNPSAGAGIAAPVGSIGFRNNSSAGETWVKIGAADTAWVDVLSSLSGWGILGNSSTVAGTNFIGTNDSVDFVIKTNAVERFRISAAGAYDTTLGTGLVHSNASGILSSSLLVNADVDASAAIAYSKLTLTNSIVNADVNSSAAIAYSKLAALTASRALQSSASGFIEAATTTATELGYVNGVTSAIQTQINSKQATGNYITALTGNITASGPGSVTATIANDVITNAMVNSAAAIVDTKLATIATAGKVSNSATTAASANTASAIVARDASGNFTAGTITAALTGNASTATALAANPTDCGVGEFANAISANGNLICGEPPGGDVVGPASATDSAIALFDTASGKLLKNSALTIADIGLYTVEVYTSGGTFTKSGTDKFIIVEVVGGGGGGGGIDGAASGVAESGGGGGGGYSFERILNSALAATETVTVGAGGGGGAGSGFATGTSGGSSSFGSLLSATGGSGGVGMNATTGSSVSAGGDGGTGTGGDINLVGGDGGNGRVLAGAPVELSWGGSTKYSQINRAEAAVGVGRAGKIYGGGAAGSITASNVDRAGGAGAAGIVIVYRYK